MGLVALRINNNNKYNMVATLNNNSKQAQRDLLKKVKKYCEFSNTDIAIIADCSPTLVSYVWSGVNSNKTVLSAIIANLKKGWDDDLTAMEVAQIEELCKN